MHSFNVSKAIANGFAAFGKKIIPLMLISILTVGLTLGLSLYSVKGIGDSLDLSSFENYSNDSSEDFEQTYEDVVNRLQNAENEEDFANEILGTIGANFDYDDIKKIEQDGEVSMMEMMSLGFGGKSEGIKSVTANASKVLFINILVAIIGFIGSIAFNTVALDAVFDRKFETNHIVKNFSKIPSLLVYGFLVSLAGGIMIFIPIIGWIGIFVFAMAMVLAPLVILEEDKGPFDGMGRSNELMKGNKLKLFGLTILAGIISGILSLVTLGIGMVFVTPIIVCILADIYKQLSTGGASVAKPVEENSTPVMNS